MVGVDCRNKGTNEMKLFLTVFAAIIAASVVIALIALAALFANLEIVGFIAVLIGIAALPAAIERAISYYKA